MPEIDNAKLREIYTTMVRIRAFEERAIAEYRKGLPGFIHSSVGQEAIPAAVCAFLRADDYIISTHRGHADIIAKGARLDKMMAELFAKETGYCKGKGGSMHIAAVDLNILGATGVVGDGIPIASGAALGCKMQKLDNVVVAFFGDGAFAFYDTVDVLKTIWGAFRSPKGMSPNYRYPENEAQTSPAKIRVKRISQMAIVVKDIPTVVKNYWNILGIGPWLIFPWEAPHIYNRQYHEKPAWAKEKIALAETENVQFEPVQPIVGDSIYQDFIEEHGEGLHHLQFIVDEVDELNDVDEAVEILSKEGFHCLQRANIGDTGAFAYIDMKPLHIIWEPIHRANDRGVEPIHYP